MDKIYDNRIKALNIMLTMTLNEYLNIVEGCLNDNEYQRKRIRNAGSIYSMLKQDLAKGCVMPPIVLAFDGIINEGDNVMKVLNDNCDKVKILDGLQRSYTIKDIRNDHVHGLYDDFEKNPLENPIRVELYSNISKTGILYRMLTLNTGQSQMTPRHQIEIIYSEYKKNCSVEGVELFSEVDKRTPHDLGQYKFRDIIEGFTSYLQRDYLTLDRMDILDSVKNLERLSNLVDDADLFNEFLKSYHLFVVRLNSLCGDTFDSEELESILKLKNAVYASSVVELFNKSQSLTGFGHAIGSLYDLNLLPSFMNLQMKIDNIKDSNIQDGIMAIIKSLDNVRSFAKRIGNDQRLYFYQFFKLLFDSKSDSYLDIQKSAECAYHEYERIAL